MTDSPHAILTHSVLSSRSLVLKEGICNPGWQLLMHDSTPSFRLAERAAISVMAQNGLSESSARLSAFGGAKRTWGAPDGPDRLRRFRPEADIGGLKFRGCSGAGAQQPLKLHWLSPAGRCGCSALMERTNRGSTARDPHVFMAKITIPKNNSATTTQMMMNLSRTW